MEKAKQDSIIHMSYDMEDIIESVFSNQGYKLPENISYKKFKGDSCNFSFKENTIYAYVSPMTCWSCVKDIKKQLESIDELKVVYIIPVEFTVDIQTFIDCVGIPMSNIYLLSRKIGLPIEEANKMFLFTVDSNNIITNVFPPTKYSQDITEAYISTILNN